MTANSELADVYSPESHSGERWMFTAASVCHFVCLSTW